MENNNTEVKTAISLISKFAREKYEEKFVEQKIEIIL